MKLQFLFISIFVVVVFSISPDNSFAREDGTAGAQDEVTYTDASASDIKEISALVRKKFAGKNKIDSLEVEAISYTSSAMQKVFIPGSFYVHVTINGQKSPGMVMCRTGSGIEMLPGRRSASLDLITPLHIDDRFRITDDEKAKFFHKALAHFYDRGDPNFTTKREAKLSGDIWTLSDILEGLYVIGYKVKTNTEGKVLEISNYSEIPKEN